MIGHGRKEGMTLRKLASLRGESIYHGKACECGSTARRVDNKCCASCYVESKEVNQRVISKSVGLFTMANSAFRITNERT